MAAIGIAKGKEFKPDERMKKVLANVAAVGNAVSRSLNWRADEVAGWSLYPGSGWTNALWEGGANFETPPPMIEPDGMFKPLPPTGATTLNSRTAFYYAYTLDSPGMMRLPKVGSQYLIGFVDADKNYFDGGKTYKVALPPNIPAAAFWSFTLYDNQTRSMLQTPQRFLVPEARVIPRPLPKRTARRRSISVRRSDAASRAIGSRPCPARAGSRSCLYSPLETFFTKEWRPSEIELVNDAMSCRLLVSFLFRLRPDIVGLCCISHSRRPLATNARGPPSHRHAWGRGSPHAPAPERSKLPRGANQDR